MHKHLLNLLAFVLAGFAALVLFRPPHPVAASPGTATGTIAYVVPNDTTGDQVWLVDPDGSHNHQIYSVGVADPYKIYAMNTLAWRPDAGELIFTSNHEQLCSWYNYDVYAILVDGSGYRRVTNGPACAALASYPKGNVTMTLPDNVLSIYMQGMSGPQSLYGTVTVKNVADLGNVAQPIVHVYGLDRWMGPAVDVKAGQTADAGVVTFPTYGTDRIGAFKPAWRSDGSRVGYSFGCAQLYGVADHPPAGDRGQPLFSANGVTPCVMAWGPTPGTADDIVYFNNTGTAGIYLTTENSTSAGTRLVPTQTYDHVFGIQYLPDASGFIYAITDHFGESSNLYLYDFGTGDTAQLTYFTNEYARDFSLSPDGGTIIFERAKATLMDPYGGPSDLWTIGLSGLTPQLFMSNAAHPSWSQRAPQLPPKLYLPLVLR